jgi:hypothetical protein
MQPNNVYYGGGAQPQTEYKRPLSRRKLLLIIGAIVLLLAVIMGALSVSGPGSQSELTDSFVQKFVSGDANGTYEMLAPSTKKIESLENWTVKVNLTKDFFTEYKRGDVVLDPPLDSAQVEVAETTDDTETITYVARGKDGEYAFTVVVSSSEEDSGVVSFGSVPYIDVRKVLRQ